MKNLKKALCLVIAIAMCFSFLAVTASADYESASKYVDWDDIVHKDAVDVLTALKVLEGKDNNLFDPLANLKRAEAAMVFLRIFASPSLSATYTLDKVEALYAALAGDTFEDVAATAWYAGAIGYGYAYNYIHGISETLFNPQRGISYLEVAKLALVAIGYDATIEGLTGSTYRANTTNLALEIGLFNDIDVDDVNAPITRDDFAQLIFNALMIQMVGYYSMGEMAIASPIGNRYLRTTGNSNRPLYGFEFYFGKETTVETGVVVANSYADAIDGDGDGYIDDADGDDVYYDVYDGETVLALPGGECYEQGWCVLAHNYRNENCPRNHTHGAVLNVPTGYDEFGREVKIVEIANVLRGMNRPTVYAAVVPTDTGDVETVTKKGVINDNADLQLVENTVWIGEHVYRDYPDTTYAEDVAYLSEDEANELALVPGFRVDLYDYNGDGMADIALYLERVLEFVNYIDEETGDVQLGMDTIYAGQNYLGVDLEVGDKILIYWDLDFDNAFVEVLEHKTGTLSRIIGDGHNEDPYDDFAGVFGGTRYDLSRIDTAGLDDVITDNLDLTFDYWLDAAHNVVLAEPTDDTISDRVFLYNLTVRDDGYYGDEVAYTVDAIDAAGNKTTYTLAAPGTVDNYYDFADLSNIFYPDTGAEPENLFRYFYIETAGTAITYFEPMGYGVSTTLAAGSLITGSENTIIEERYVGTVPSDPVDAGATTFNGFVNDDTVFFFLTTSATGVETVVPVTGINSIARLYWGTLANVFQVYGDGDGNWMNSVVCVDLDDISYTKFPGVVNGTVDDMSNYMFISEQSYEQKTEKYISGALTYDVVGINIKTGAEMKLTVLASVADDDNSPFNNPYMVGGTYSVGGWLVDKSQSVATVADLEAAILDLGNSGIIEAISTETSRLALSRPVIGYPEVLDTYSYEGTAIATLTLNSSTGSFAYSMGDADDLAEGSLVFLLKDNPYGGVNTSAASINFMLVIGGIY